MPRTVQLKNVDHKHLRIDTRRAPGLGDDVICAPTFPSEFRNVQAHYPIVFAKTAQGSFQPMALFASWQSSISSSLPGVCRNTNCAPRGDVWRRETFKPSASS